MSGWSIHSRSPGRLRASVQTGITTSTLGLGTGIDDALLSGMAEAGGGNFAFVEHPNGLPAFFARELGRGAFRRCDVRGRSR